MAHASREPFPHVITHKLRVFLCESAFSYGIVENSMSEPNLAPPGAGLPGPEAFAVRNLVFPVLKLKLNRTSSLALFEKSGQAILPLIRDLDLTTCLLYTSPSPRDRQKSRMPSSA